MNFKKFKRLLSVALSASMLLSTNMTTLAAETAAPAPTNIAVEEENHEHNWQLDNVIKEATATEDGIGTYSCAECGTTKDGAIMSAADDTGDGNGSNAEAEHSHTLEKKDRVAPTCWEEGTISYWECKECGKMFLTSSADDELTAEDIKIDKLDHQAVISPAVPVSCMTVGYKEYYYCRNCPERLYENLEKFAKGSTEKGTEKTDWFKNKVDFKIAATGHSFNGANAYTFDWDSLASFDDFQKDQANGVTAERSCDNCEYKEEAASVKVTREISTNFDCKNGGDVTYTATASFEKDNMEKPVEKDPFAKTETHKRTETPGPNAAHDYEYKFNWDNFLPRAGADNKLAYYQSGITAMRICSICKAEDTAPLTVNVTETDDAFDAATDDILCDADKSIKFTASIPGATTDDEPIASEDKTVLVKKTAHVLNVTRGTKATCEKDGSYTYFHCSRCDKDYWDEDAKTSLKEGESVTISALGHSFGLPEFSWDNEVLKDRAQATFKCIRQDCPAQVTLGNLAVAEEGIYLRPNAGSTCGDTVTLSYATSVKFDRTAVKKENGSYIYDSEKIDKNEITYKGYVEKDNTLNHEFEQQITWNSQLNASGTYDTEKGITVTLTCKTCGGIITCNSAGGTVQGSGTLAGTTGTIAFTKNSSESRTATCTEAGKEVFDITIRCNTHDTTKMLYDITGKIENPKPATGHDYAVTLSNKQVTAEGPSAAAALTCQNNCGSTLSSSKETDGVTLSFEPTTDTDLEYAPATCMTSGKDVWKVTVSYDNGKQITEDANHNPLTVTNNTTALGHKYDAAPDWDWSKYCKADPYDPNSFIKLEGDDLSVYADYTCTNPSCDGLEDQSDTSQEEGSGPNKDGKWVRKIAAAVSEEAGTAATCTQDGTITCKAVSGKFSDSKNIVQKATGHKLNTETVVWGSWEKVKENGQDVMADVVIGEGDDAKTYSIPVYQITASLVCENTNCPLENKSVSVTGRSDKKLSDGEKRNNCVEITVTHTPNGCENSGNTEYNAKAYFYDEKNQVITFENNSDTSTRTDMKPETGHDYELKWTWMGSIAGSETPVEVTEKNETDIIAYTSATLTRICKNDTAHNSQPVPGTLKITTDPADVNTPSCTQGLVAYYDVEASLGDDTSATKYTDRKVIVKEALGHNYGWMFENDWEEIIENPDAEIKAFYGCINEQPEDLWTDTTNKYDIKTVILEKDDAQSTESTCSTKGAEVWNLKLKDTGAVIGTHKIPVDIDPSKHKEQGAVKLNWETLQASDRDAAGNVTFKIEGTRTCAYGDHPITVNGTGRASLGDFSCGAALTVDCTFDFGKDVAIEDGNTQPLEYEAADHEMTFIKASEKVCGKPYYPAHFRCIHCGKAFLNPSESSETVISTSTILAHSFGTPTFSWIEQGKTAQAVFNCANCTVTRRFVADVGKKLVTDEPTCQKTGEAYYSVDLYLTDLEDKTGFDADYYPGNVIETLEKVDHSFNEDGACIYKDCTATAKDTVKLTSYGQGGKVIRETWIARNSQSVTLPTAPNQFGYEFKGWKFGDTVYSTSQYTNLQTALKAEMSKPATTELKLYAVYETKKKAVTVNLYRVVDGKKESTAYKTTQNVAEGTVHALTADETAGEAVFSHWSLAENGTSVLSVNRNYNLLIANIKENETEKNIYAVYTSDPEETTQNRIVISDVYTSQVDGAFKISFATAMSMPEDATWVSSGFMYSTAADFGTTHATEAAQKAALTVGKADGTVVKQKSLTGKVANVLTINLGTNEANKNRDIYVRGYLFYEDSEGNLHECYTDVTVGSFNNPTN